mmetsp:Transcript_41027/g.66532  ORF Transcript_41027/g.66532 Transcript_41027/m.66532 type:complete len:125 (+) Transcript_41027:1184-1558(+)
MQNQKMRAPLDTSTLFWKGSSDMKLLEMKGISYQASCMSTSVGEINSRRLVSQDFILPDGLGAFLAPLYNTLLSVHVRSHERLVWFLTRFFAGRHTCQDRAYYSQANDSGYRINTECHSGRHRS